MRLVRTGILVLVVLLAGAAIAVAQITDNHNIIIDTTGFSVIDLSDDSTITLEVSPPALPGDPPLGDTNDEKYLFYTVLTPAGTPQSINAAIDAAAPTGTTLQLVVSDMGGAGGTATATINLDTGAQPIILDIPSTRTGRTASPGSAPRLLYTLVVDPATIVATVAGQTRTVTFTITEP